MRTLIVVLMAAGLGLNGWAPANAQDASRRALAEELLNEMNMKETVEKSFAMIKKMIPAQMEKMMPATEKTDSPSGVAKQTAKAKSKVAMDKVMDSVAQEMSWENLKEDYISIYAETFTEEELRGIIAFYKSPAGKAFTKKQPELMASSMKLSQKRMFQMMPKIQAMFKDAKEPASPPAERRKESKKAAPPPETP